MEFEIEGLGDEITVYALDPCDAITDMGAKAHSSDDVLRHSRSCSRRAAISKLYSRTHQSHTGRLVLTILLESLQFFRSSTVIADRTSTASSN
jgi:hypothetical protein